MPKGSCVCGDWTYEFSGEPGTIVRTTLEIPSTITDQAQIICHCKPCQKTAGLNGSYEFVIPDSAVSQTKQCKVFPIHMLTAP